MSDTEKGKEVRGAEKFFDGEGKEASEDAGDNMKESGPSKQAASHPKNTYVISVTNEVCRRPKALVVFYLT